MPVKVLVTGGSGYVAGWCINELLQRDYAVATTVRDAATERDLRTTFAAHGGDDPQRLTVVAADLTRDDGWDRAVIDCDYVLHVASPLGGTHEPNSLLAPARDGTLRVLRAALDAGVERVVMTSAAAAARPPHGTATVSNEDIWADATDVQFDAYRRSKILAERAAWDFIESTRATMTLTTILPGAVFGPVLMRRNSGSVEIIGRLLRGNPAAIPRLGFWVIDVRDLADLHLRAMTAPEAAGQRFIAAGEFVWMEDVARVLRSRIGAAADKVPTRRLPTFAARLLGFFNPALRSVLPLLGQTNPLTAEKARAVLGFEPRPAADTIEDCARSLMGTADA
jgi:nucleoside-diphosphate-sugar epimerase